MKTNPSFRWAPIALGAAALLVVVAALMPTWRDPRPRSESRAAVPPGASAPDASSEDARFAAASDLFELVGALEGRRLTLWLDRFADNAPVVGATLELEIGETRVVARAVDDRYEADLPSPPAPGTLPVTVTVTAGKDMDLLAADLVVTARTEGSR